MQNAQDSRLDRNCSNSPAPHVRVCYRHHPRGRVFIANSSKCVDAVIRGVSRRGIDLLTNVYLAPATPVRVEMGHSGLAPLMDMAAEVVTSEVAPNGAWRSVCKWARTLTPEQLIASCRE